MNITAEQADRLKRDATDGPRIPSQSGYIGSVTGVMIHDGQVLGDTAADTALIAAAPDLAQTVIDQAKRIEELEAQLAGMTEEWGVETKSHQFGLHWEWYDNEDAAKKAHGYQVDIWRARNRQKVMPIRRRFIMEVIEGA